VGDALLGLLVANVLAIVVGTMILVAAGHAETDADELPLTLIALIQVPLWVGYLGAPLWAAARKGARLVEDFGLRVTWADVPLGLVAGALTQLLLIPILYLPIFWVFGDQDLSAEARELTDRADSPLGVVLLIVIVVIGAPIIEELFFRGLFLRALERRWNTPVAVIVSSAVFGLVHLQLLQLPALILFGAVAAFLAVRTGRLGAPIFAHVAFNAIAVATLLWA
jgi:membrane protease YdiL (CAAX protease family)